MDDRRKSRVELCFATKMPRKIRIVEKVLTAVDSALCLVELKKCLNSGYITRIFCFLHCIGSAFLFPKVFYLWYTPIYYVSCNVLNRFPDRLTHPLTCSRPDFQYKCLY